MWFKTKVMEAYPEEITVIFFYNLFATLISAPVCFFAERNLTSWVLKPDISLAAIIYSVSIKPYMWLTIFYAHKLTLFYSGSLAFTIWLSYAHMGSASEGSSLYIIVQTIVYSHCSHLGCYIPRRCTLPWEVLYAFVDIVYVYQGSNNFPCMCCGQCHRVCDFELRILHCDLGKSKRGCNQNCDWFWTVTFVTYTRCRRWSLVIKIRLMQVKSLYCWFINNDPLKYGLCLCLYVSIFYLQYKM